MIKKIISGGQTGAEQAALDAAIQCHMLLHMTIIESEMSNPMNPAPILPETIEGVIERLIDELSLRDKVHIARMEESEIANLHPSFGSYIRNKYLWNGNEPLIMDCMYRSGNNDMDENEASKMIIYALWKRLKETHQLRVIK